MQNKITQRQPLLNDKGELNARGYATELILDYDRKKIAASKLRIKEWDYYYVGNNSYGVAITIADNGYMGLANMSLIDFRNDINLTKGNVLVFPMGKLNMPPSSVSGDVSHSTKKCQVIFNNDGQTRIIKVKQDNFYGKPMDLEIKLTNPPRDSMVIATPFKDAPTAFYYNQKINCLEVDGYAKWGDTVYSFNKENGSMGVLDWGRGVWTYKNIWLWSSLSTYIGDHKFGFNLGYGFGDTSAASENMLFYDGIAHKLDKVDFYIPAKNGKDDFMSTWAFTANDRRVELEFKPLMDRYADINIGILRSLQHQVFGEFSGKAILDDGTIITLNKVVGFAEKLYNKW